MNWSSDLWNHEERNCRQRRLKHLQLVPTEKQKQDGRTHHGGMNVNVTKRAHVREHGGSISQEVLDFSTWRGAHPPLHKDRVWQQRPRTEPSVRRLVGKLWIRPLCSPISSATITRTKSPARWDILHGAEPKICRSLSPGRAWTQRGVPSVSSTLIWSLWRCPPPLSWSPLSALEPHEDAWQCLHCDFVFRDFSQNV